MRKRLIPAAAAVVAVLALAMTPAVYAHDDDLGVAGAAALGLALGAVIAPPPVVYQAPPPVVYDYPPPRYYRPYYAAPAPRVYLYGGGDDDWHDHHGDYHRWHRDWHHRWRHEDHRDWHHGDRRWGDH